MAGGASGSSGQDGGNRGGGAGGTGACGRLIVVGRSSAVWARIGDRVCARHLDTLAVGHRDIPTLSIDGADRVWILSYARSDRDNVALFEAIRDAGGDRADVVYLSSATANIAARAPCYGYPRVKAAAEEQAVALLGARVVRIGLVYDDVSELPAGCNAATSLAALIDAIAGVAPPPGTLFAMVDRPFASAVEQRAFRIYGQLMAAARTRPCLLRPVDALLRALGWRWYGYLFLSNRSYRAGQ